MNDIGKELYERVRADFERRLKSDKRPPKDMRGVSDYSARVGRYLAEAIAANVTEDALPDGGTNKVGTLYYNIAESILEPSLRTNYELVNDAAAEVQRLLDERQGLHIKPARADYPEERVHAVIGAASEEGIEFDRALRRMTSPAENITQSFADDFMQANAEQRSRAGFDTFIERQGGLNCCPWCAGLVGVFAYPKGLPKEVFARHDNCTCSVTYGTKGGARQHVWSKQTWSSEQEREYLKLTDEAKRGNGGKRLTPKQIAAIREKVQAPHRLTKEQAAALGAFAQPRRLTGGANGGIMLPEIIIGRSVGAKAKNYDIMDLATGEIFHLVEGSRLQNVQVFAGKGNHKPYEKAWKYANKHGGKVEDWQHVKGFGLVDYYGEEREAELHWSQCEGIGKYDFFIKRWLDES